MTKSFGALLKELRQDAKLKQKDVAENAGMDPAILSRLESEKAPPPDRSTVLGLARAMNLSPRRVDDLLESADYPPETLLDIAGINLRDESIRALLHEFAALRKGAGKDTDWSQAVEEAVRLMLRGARDAQSDALRGLVPQPLPEKDVLTSEEQEIDDLLTSILAGEAEPGRVGQLLSGLQKGDLPWELRRRIAEALPRLVELDAGVAFDIADILRMDYDERRWHSDLRRRTVEAVPVLYRYDRQRAVALLFPQVQDQVYVNIATIEALHSLPDIAPEDVQHIRYQLREKEDPEHAGAAEFLSGLLDQIKEGRAASALEAMKGGLGRHRIFRTCIMRCLSRLLDTEVAVEALWLTLHLYRRTCGEIAEHRNTRRPAVMGLKKLISLLDNGGEPALLARVLIWQFAQDEEAIARRHVADALPSLMMAHRGFAKQLIDDLVTDCDVYVRRRAWDAQGRLSGGGRES